MRKVYGIQYTVFKFEKTVRSEEGVCLWITYRACVTDVGVIDYLELTWEGRAWVCDWLQYMCENVGVTIVTTYRALMKKMGVIICSACAKPWVWLFTVHVWRTLVWLKRKCEKCEFDFLQSMCEERGCDFLCCMCEECGWDFSQCGCDYLVTVNGRRTCVWLFTVHERRTWVWLFTVHGRRTWVLLFTVHVRRTWVWLYAVHVRRRGRDYLHRMCE
jgi:hypothetical protein